MGEGFNQHILSYLAKCFKSMLGVQGLKPLADLMVAEMLAQILATGAAAAQQTSVREVQALQIVSWSRAVAAGREATVVPTPLKAGMVAA
jgi:hypothetical protein